MTEPVSEAVELLIAQLEKATGGSIELDGLIAQALGEMPAEFRWGTKDAWGDDIGRWTTGGFGGYEFHEPEPYTSSIDAALALVERVLPNCLWHIEPDACWLHVLTEEDVDDFQGNYTGGNGNMTPLAICLALLRALLQREKQP